MYTGFLLLLFFEYLAKGVENKKYFSPQFRIQNSEFWIEN